MNKIKHHCVAHYVWKASFFEVLETVVHITTRVSKTGVKVQVGVKFERLGDFH